MSMHQKSMKKLAFGLPVLSLIHTGQVIVHFFSTGRPECLLVHVIDFFISQRFEAFGERFLCDHHKLFIDKFAVSIAVKHTDEFLGFPFSEFLTHIS